jgi:hypothetical protein
MAGPKLVRDAHVPVDDKSVRRPDVQIIERHVAHDALPAGSFKNDVLIPAKKAIGEPEVQVSPLKMIVPLPTETSP